MTRNLWMEWAILTQSPWLVHWFGTLAGWFICWDFY